MQTYFGMRTISVVDLPGTSYPYVAINGAPVFLRSDNGPEFVAKDLRKWLADTGAKTLYIEPGSPWENGYCESFNSKLRDEFLNSEIFRVVVRG